MLAEASHVQGFMQLLMKQRNGSPWSSEDKAALRLHLKHLASTLPLFGFFALPGGSLLLPLLALLLDRRRKRRGSASNAGSRGEPAGDRSRFREPRRGGRDE